MRAVATAKLKTAPVSTTGNAGVPQIWTAYILVAFWLLTEKHTVSPTRAVRHQFLSQRSPEEHWHRVDADRLQSHDPNFQKYTRFEGWQSRCREQDKVRSRQAA